MRVLIVDDHDLFAVSLARLLGSSDAVDHVDVCTRVTDLDESNVSEDLDVVLADWNLTDGTGVDVLDRTRRFAPGVPVVVLTGEAGPEVARAAFEAGCDGFVTKDSAPEQLISAMMAAIRGEMQFSSTAAEFLRSAPPPPSGGFGLSDRELEVITMLAGSMTNREIAAELYLSPNTVRNHIARISKKMGASSRVDIVMRAAQSGLVSLDRVGSRTDQRA